MKIGYFRAYGAFWRYYADFTRRTTKEAFWKAWVVHTAIMLALTSPAYYCFQSIVERSDIYATMWLIPLGAYSIATIFPSIAIILRRLHDTDRHGCWFLLCLIPYVGWIPVFIMLARSSAPYDVFPGRSGRGPYTDYVAAQQPYVRSPYEQQQQQQQQGYAPMYQRPLPPPRHYSPPAGGNKSVVAIVLAIVLMATNLGYGFVLNNYIQKNSEAFYSVIFEQALSGFDLSDLYDLYGDYGNWDFGAGDDWENWAEEWDGDGWEEWDDEGFEDDWGDLSAEEQAVVNLVRESTLPGLPEFTIEEVLLSAVDEDGLEWGAFEEEGDEFSSYYVYAMGYTTGAFDLIYAGFGVHSDGTVEIYNLDNGERDEYDEDAFEFFKEWYDSMLSNSGTGV
ncbi:MAG: DUF805 domain-containing protein [Clostridiales bacterium]|nr:DUF805 domain-containing protein [Clostridiales bacterium]